MLKDKKTGIILTLVLALLTQSIYAQTNDILNTQDKNVNLNENETNVNKWEIDKGRTALEILKMSAIVIVPVSLFVAGSVIKKDPFKKTFLISASVLAVPALFGVVVFTIDIIRFDPNEDSFGDEIEEYEQESYKLKRINIAIKKRF